MNMVPQGLLSPVYYLDSDGKQLADNTKQARWIFVLFGNLCALFRAAADVFVAADLLWYPVEGHPEIRVAPVVFVAFGLSKKDRGSYKQWDEEGIPPAVVFEILSPGNNYQEMIDKFLFYEEYGVEEYYVYDPDRNRLEVYVRRNELLLVQRPADGFTSPLLKIRFDLSGPEMVVYGPNGRRFLTFEELQEVSDRAESLAEQATRRAETAETRAEQAEERAERLARLAELGRKARRGEASEEELREFDRLETESLPPRN